MKKYVLFIIIFAILSISQICFGLATEQIGPNSSLGHETGSQPSWPKGIYEITNLDSREYSIWVNGNENFYFNGDVEEINEMINLFSKVAIRDHVVQILSDKGTTKTFGGVEIGYNVRLQLVEGIALFMTREEQRESLPLEPCLSILTGGDNSIIEKLKWPDNIIIEKFIPEIPVKSKMQQPKRDYYYGLLEFADGSPSQEFVSGVKSRITLWQKDVNDGINIGDVNNKGYFTILLSEVELANLKTGKMWLTCTIANYLTEAKKTDQKFPVEMLVKEKEKAESVKVAGLPYYYGRILFEDGSPAIADSSIWKGSEIHVDFSYAGMGHIDSEGYFKVFFTPEQYKKAQESKERKNIYVPTGPNSGRAMHTFPVTELSQDKSKAGVVKIPRPVPPKQELSTVKSKVGKQIPGFEKIKSADFQPEQAKDKPLLVCFWDIDQRPSRQYILDLEKNKVVLEGKNIQVLIIHAGTKVENEVKHWIQENKVSIASGIIEGEPYDTLLTWGARGLPWLVLTDDKHVITKAGFNIDELADMK
ncbi:MAG: hypothetical protein JW787_17385 [Sedimentisphaerales bacterium]|nr:hypothetical protein [Sedimentisphaerales bacterium]